MKPLLNTLYITKEDAYAFLENGNVVVKEGNDILGKFPLLTLSGIVMFTNKGASPYLMNACIENEILLSMYSPSGKFLAQASGMPHGNVLLRREQYRIADNDIKSLAIARSMIVGKIYNGRWSIERTIRDHGTVINTEKLETISNYLYSVLQMINDVASTVELRGIEGKSAVAYFMAINDMIITNKESFIFKSRNRRPPTDTVNAMLSFAYSLLANECSQALISVGFDPYVGFMHRDRPGRHSLALDLMEELRPIIGDRFVLTLINDRKINQGDFEVQENGAVLLTNPGRKRFLSAWQERKMVEITHPYLQEKVPWGLVPYIQAQLLRKYIRGDIDGYPPLLWK